MTGTKCRHFSSIGTWKICNDEQCHKRKKDKLGFDAKLIENNDDGSDKEYIRKADVKYPKKLHELHSDLLFLLERMKFENSEKLVCNPYNKKNCYTHKIPKAGAISWIIATKKTSRNQTQSRSMARAIHWLD